jgi:hypothetical protein
MDLADLCIRTWVQPYVQAQLWYWPGPISTPGKDAGTARRIYAIDRWPVTDIGADVRGDTPALCRVGLFASALSAKSNSMASDARFCPLISSRPRTTFGCDARRTSDGDSRQRKGATGTKARRYSSAYVPSSLLRPLYWRRIWIAAGQLVGSSHLSFAHRRLEAGGSDVTAARRRGM